MFDDDDHLESRAFPPLHKIILGLSSSVALRDYLELDSSAIDQRDTDGYTALIWAAARGDDSAVSVLLSFGADPNLANNRKQTALHMAAQGHDPRVIKIMRDLIRAGAETDPSDYWRRTPLLYAAAEQDFDDAAFLEPLLETHEVNLDHQDVRERTPLGYAALMGRPKTVQALLDAGADPTIAANWGYTPAIEALVSNHHSCLEILLEFHRSKRLPLLRPGVEIIGGRNVLHLLAEYADAKTMAVFQRFLDGLQLAPDQIDPEAKSGDGLTPDDSFVGRDEVDQKTTVAWGELLRAAKDSLARHVSRPATPDSDEPSAEVFEDAKEFL